MMKIKHMNINYIKLYFYEQEEYLPNFQNKKTGIYFYKNVYYYVTELNLQYRYDEYPDRSFWYKNKYICGFCNDSISIYLFKIKEKVEYIYVKNHKTNCGYWKRIEECEVEDETVNVYISKKSHNLYLDSDQFVVNWCGLSYDECSSNGNKKIYDLSIIKKNGNIDKESILT